MSSCLSFSETVPKRKSKHRGWNSKSHHNKKKMTFSVSLPKMPKAYVVIWVTYYIMLYSSLMTLIMYQTELFRGNRILENVYIDIL